MDRIANNSVCFDYIIAWAECKPTMHHDIHVLFQIIVGLLFADIIISFLHWLEDTYLDYHQSIQWLARIAQENHLHHYFPREILVTDVLQDLCVTVPLTLIVAVIVYMIAPEWVANHPWLIGTMFVLGCASHTIHKTAHMRDCERPRFFTLLHRLGVLVDHEHHRAHHDEPSVKYGILLPVTNDVLDGLGAWRCLEAVVERVIGIKPNRVEPYDVLVTRVGATGLHNDSAQDCPKKPTQEQVNELAANLRAFHESDKKDCVNKNAIIK